MSRSTQYIGLTNEAIKFTQTLRKREPNDNTAGKNLGMFDEDVDMSCWEDEHGNIWDEVCLLSPWSSGPMLFNCLQNRQTKEKRFQWNRINTGIYHPEYDPEKGECYI